MTGGILTGEPESPTFADGVPANAAAAAAALWMRSCDPDAEREHLLRIIVEGELIILDDGTTVPADGFEPMLAGPDWNQRVTGYKIGRSSTARSEGLYYLGDRREGDARGGPMDRPGAALRLPRSSTSESAAGHGLGALAKIAAHHREHLA